MYGNRLVSKIPQATSNTTNDRQGAETQTRIDQPHKSAHCATSKNATNYVPGTTPLDDRTDAPLKGTRNSANGWTYDWIRSMRICVANRIASDIGIGIDASGQPDRIGLYISSSSRIIVAVVVVVERGLAVIVLAGEAQVEGEAAGAGRILVWRIAAEGLIVAPAPNHLGVCAAEAPCHPDGGGKRW